MTEANDNRIRSPAEKLDEIERRLTRIESRVVQLMMHFGLDPGARVYDQSDMKTLTTRKPK
jgi:hypothetical protein